MQVFSSAFVLLLTVTTIVSGGGHETPQQVVTRYNNYKTICTGLGYQNVPCDAGNGGKSIFIFYIPKKSPLHGEILPMQRKTLSIQSIIQYLPKYYDLHLKRSAVARNRRGGGTKVR